MPPFKNGTFIHVAARYCQCGALEHLAQTGAELEAKDLRGNTAVRTAAMYGQLAALSILHKAGACVDALDFEGFSPAYIAAQHGLVDILAYLRGVSGQKLLDFRHAENDSTLTSIATHF